MLFWRWFVVKERVIRAIVEAGVIKKTHKTVAEFLHKAVEVV